MKAIAFSLFGNAPIYLHGAVRNAHLAEHFYPDWKPIFYCDEETVPSGTIADLAGLGAEVRLYSKSEYPNGMFARFLVADDPTVERFIIRDVDSRLSWREVNAVNAWIQSGKSVHIMRDHPWHCSLIMGGLWGAKAGVLRNVEQAIKTFSRAKFIYSRETQYGADQEFLVRYLWPKALGRALIHDSFCRHGMTGEPFPDGLLSKDFVGSIYDLNEKPNAEHQKVREDWIIGRTPKT